MRNMLLLVCAVALLLPLPAFAEIKVVTHTVQQPFGGSQSPDDARTAGIARAKREALEQFGTYIESTTVVKDSQVDSDEILALTAGVTKAEVIKQKNYTDGDGFGLEITVKVELDTAVLDQSLKRLLQDRNHLKDLTAARVREKQLLARIEELERQNQQKGKTQKQKEILKKEFQKTREGLTAVEWFDKAYALWDGKKYTNPQKVLEFLTRAIQLDPSDAEAYNNRGVAYSALEQYQQAITDYSQAIQLNPAFAAAYYNRGSVYAGLKRYQLAITDYNSAILQNPSYASAYYNRGNANYNIKQYQKAISDYSNSIAFDANHALAYYNRGMAYAALKQYRQAIDDYNKTLQMDNSVVGAYNNRGLVYKALEKYQLAISDFNKAILLSPNNGALYLNRGVSHILVGNMMDGCRDVYRACRMGECEAYKVSQEEGLCR